MHPMGETFSGATCDTRFRCLPSVRLGVVKSFVSWHVGLACQLLATNVACRKCVGWSQGLNMSLIYERQSHLPVWGLPRSPWPCCLSPRTYGTYFFIKEMRWRAKVHRRVVDAKRIERSQGKTSGIKPCPQGHIYVRRRSSATHAFCCWTGFEPKRETRRCCVTVDQDTRQASMLSSKIMLVITKEDMLCSGCVSMARGTVLVARWRPR
jgi:hypothetical protein